MKLSPAFLIIALVGNMYGWKESALVAFLSDLIQSLLYGGFSPLISLIALLTGACFGWLLKDNKRVSKIVISVLLTQVIGSLVLVTAVLNLQYGIPFIPLIYFRALQTAILIILEIPLLILFIRILDISGKIKKISQ
jgi:ECF transporter S component (folate family)